MYGTTSAEIIIFKKRNKLNSHIFGEPMDEITTPLKRLRKNIFQSCYT